MGILKSNINYWDIKNKTIFLRADLNVKIINGKIFNDFKLKSILPTLDLLISKNAKIILATHLGRPEKNGSEKSTQILEKYFKDLNYNIIFENSLDKQKIDNILSNYSIVLLENLRFYPEEKEPNQEFAQKLKCLSDFYINDAFGVCHRNNTSVTLLPKLFNKNNKSIGLLIEKELINLNKLKENPTRPLTLILGGGKIKDKLKLVESLMHIADKIILCPGLVFTYLWSQNYKICKSQVDPDLIQYCINLNKLAAQNNIKIITPIDFIVADSINLENLRYKKLEEVKEEDFGVTIGNRSLKIFKPEIEDSKSIFFNCATGFFEEPKTLGSLKELLNTVSHSNAFKVVGGGESVAAVELFAIHKIDFCSTGGGATLAYLADQPMPGLEFI